MSTLILNLVIALILIISAFILYTAYFTRKYSFLTDKKEEILEAYREFYYKFQADEYYSGKDFNDWLEKYAKYKTVIMDYKYNIEKLNSIRIKSKRLQAIIADYVRIFLLKKEYEDIIMFMYRLYDEGENIWEKRNQEFIEKEIDSFDESFTKCFGDKLTIEQKRSIIKDEHNTVIKNGVDKITPIIAKTVYLLRKGYAEPKDVLIISLNNEERKRIEEELSSCIEDEIRVHSLQSLSFEIVEKTTGKTPKLYENTEEELVKTIESLLTTKLSDSEFTEKINEYFYYLKSSHANKGKEYAEYSGKLKPRTLRGEEVKNLGEQSVANFLYRNGVNYQYIDSSPIEMEKQQRKAYIPEFYLPDQKIWIAHFEIDRDCTILSDIERDQYLDSWYWKRKKHREEMTELIETFSYLRKEDTLIDTLKNMLLVRGVRFNPIDPEKIVDTLRSTGDFEELSASLAQLLRLYKSDKEKYEKTVARLKMKENLGFNKITQTIFDEYEKMLHDSGYIDIDDLINQAIEVYTQGRALTGFRYIIYDDTRNLNKNYNQLLESIVSQRPESKIIHIID